MIMKIPAAPKKSSRTNLGRSGRLALAARRARMDSSSESETSVLMVGGNASWSVRTPTTGSGSFRTASASVSRRPRFVNVRTRYITASASPHARLQPSAVYSIFRPASSPAVAETVPTKVNAMNSPKHNSETRSTVSRIGSRVSVSSCCVKLLTGISPLSSTVAPCSMQAGCADSSGCEPTRRAEQCSCKAMADRCQ